MSKFTAYVETPAGDLIAVASIASVRHWPPSGLSLTTRAEHRVQLETDRGAIWELYRGPSEENAIAVRDAMKARIREAIAPPRAPKPVDCSPSPTERYIQQEKAQKI